MLVNPRPPGVVVVGGEDLQDGGTISVQSNVKLLYTQDVPAEEAGRIITKAKMSVSRKTEKMFNRPIYFLFLNIM